MVLRIYIMLPLLTVEIQETSAEELNTCCHR